MRLRFIVLLVVSSGDFDVLNAATKADWDCQQSEDGKEWVCVSTRKSAKPVEQESIEPPVQKKKLEAVAPKKTAPQPLPETATLISEPGWHCKADQNGSGWDCNLVGPDPNGAPRIVSEDESSTLSITTFDPAEAALYKDLIAKIPDDPWAQCSLRLGPSVPIDVRDARIEAPMNIEANFTDVFEQEIVSFSGDVEFSRADQKVWADQAYYDRQSQTLNARGNVFFRDRGLMMYSDSAFLKLQSDKAHLTNSRYIFDTVPARGQAQVVYQDSKMLYRLKDVSYTTCQPGNLDWVLTAKHLKIDKDSGTAQALDAWLNIKGLPVLYSPYISFPVDDRRKSGFLAPSFGSTDETGFDATSPYYWNIAPNFDMTISPRVMSRRGFMFGSEIRYLTKRTDTEFRVEIIPHDREQEEARGQATLLNHTQFNSNLSAEIDANYVSDDDYLDQLGNSLSFSDTRHVRSRADIRYRQPDLSMFGRLDYYQTIDSSIDGTQRPYRRLPQLVFNYSPQLTPDTQINLDSEFVYFERSNSVSGQRLNLRPGIRYTHEIPFLFVKPSVSLDYTQYWLDDPSKVFPDSRDRILPIASIDSGVFFERDLDFFGKTFLQTLEPRVFYLYIPDESQDDIPLFDTSEFDFNFNQLFRENRFNGNDRLGDANQMAVTVNSRLIDDSNGRQRLNAGIGQIFFFDDQDVTVDPTISRRTTSTSNLIAELDALIIDGLDFRSSIQWDPDRNNIARGQASLQYRDGLSKIVNASYRYRKDPNTNLKTIDQGDFSFRWPLNSSVNAVGRWQYSLLDNVTLESFLGFEKENCCWRFRLLGRYYVNDINSEPQTGIFVQLELKGFTSFGEQVDRFLERNIRGFRVPEE